MRREDNYRVLRFMTLCETITNEAQQSTSHAAVSAEEDGNQRRDMLALCEVLLRECRALLEERVAESNNDGDDREDDVEHM